MSLQSGYSFLPSILAAFNTANNGPACVISRVRSARVISVFLRKMVRYFKREVVAIKFILMSHLQVFHTRLRC